MIYINYDGPASTMLHTKLRGNRPTGSGEEDFLKVFAIYSHGGHLGHVTWTSFPLTDGRRTDAGAWVYYIPSAQVSL